MKKPPKKTKPADPSPLALRMSEAERHILQDAADRAGVSLSRWVREAALSVARTGEDGTRAEVALDGDTAMATLTCSLTGRVLLRLPLKIAPLAMTAEQLARVNDLAGWLKDGLPTKPRPKSK